MYLSNGIFQKAVIDFLDHKKKKFVKYSEALLSFHPGFITPLKVMKSTDVEVVFCSLENLSSFCENLKDIEDQLNLIVIENMENHVEFLKSTLFQISYMANFIKLTAQHQLDEI